MKMEPEIIIKKKRKPAKHIQNNLKVIDRGLQDIESLKK